MSSSVFDLYKGTARSKRKAKATGEISQPNAKKGRVEEPIAPRRVDPVREVSLVLPDAVNLETPQGEITSLAQDDEGLG